MASVQETPVLIVGGGLAGLTMACLLAKQNTKCILIEKHLKSSPHPRAVGFTTRTMEIFSELGIVDQIPQMTADFRLRRVQIESLAGTWGQELGRELGSPPSNSSSATYSQFTGAAIAQDKLEPMLRQRAEDLACDLRFGHKMLSFNAESNHDDQVTLRVRDESEREYTIRASYLVAADGHRSTIRESLHIPTSGRGHLQTLTSVLFRAPSLSKYLESGFHQFHIRQPDGFGGFLTTYNDSRWVLMFQDDQQRSKSELQEAILQATGIPNLDYEVLATGKWELQARIAESFAFPTGEDVCPRVFLTGDAAHTLPPTRGGYGANTGIADAHNLAWKLSSVLNGLSSPSLLRSYDAERRAVAWVRHNQTFAGPDYAHWKRDGDDFGNFRDPVAVELGQVYESGAIVTEDKTTDDRPVTLKPDELNGQPGSRAPYVVLKRTDGSKTSTLDISAGHWTLIATNKEWVSIGNEVSKQLEFPLTIEVISGECLVEEYQRAIADAFGTEGGGAALIRPDGHIAWRCQTTTDSKTTQEQLCRALTRAASLSGPA